MSKKKKVKIESYWLYSEDDHGLFHHNYYFVRIQTIGTKTFYVYKGDGWIKKSFCHG